MDQPLGQEARLVVLDRSSHVVDDFLQSDDIRFDPLQHSRDSFHACAAVQATPFMDVVNCNPEGSHLN
jgi:hypothetical protein